MYNHIVYKLISKSNSVGILIDKNIIKSNTAFGTSWYIPFKSNINFSVRISDHFVGKWRASEPQIYIFSKNIDKEIDSVIDLYFKRISGINMNNFYKSTSETKQKYFKLKQSLMV